MVRTGIAFHSTTKAFRNWGIVVGDSVAYVPSCQARPINSAQLETNPDCKGVNQVEQCHCRQEAPYRPLQRGIGRYLVGTSVGFAAEWGLQQGVKVGLDI